MHISVVILNWNGRHFLEKYLPGVELHSQLPDVQIVVADNGSTDDSISYLEKNHPNVHLIKLDANYGFAEGYNRALQEVQADFYVLLNSDVEVSAGWLEPLIQMMQEKPDIAACMPKIRAVSERDYFEYAGAAGGFIDKYGYAFCRGRIFYSIEKDIGQYDTETEIFWATGACCMVDAKLFHKMGGFDKIFFAHMEEIDLCWRLKNAGHTIWYTPHSVVYHVGGGMLPKSSPVKTYLNYRNNLLMLRKNLPAKQRWKIMFQRKILDVMSAFYSLLKGDVSTFKAIFKAHKNYRKLRRLYSKTRAPAAFPTCVYQKSIVFQYFIKKQYIL